MKKYIILIPLLLLALWVGYSLQPTVRNSQIVQHEDSITVARSEIAQIKRREVELKAAIEEHDRREVSAKREYERRIVVLKARVKTQQSRWQWAQSAELDSLRTGIYGHHGNDTLYALPIDQARDALITKAIQPMNDSLYSEQVARVAEIEREKINQAAQFKSVISLKNEELKREKSINGYLSDIMMEQEKENKKRKIKRVLEKVGMVGIGLGIGSLLK